MQRSASDGFYNGRNMPPLDFGVRGQGRLRLLLKLCTCIGFIRHSYLSQSPRHDLFAYVADDPDAMPMWEGYELGEKGLEDEENDSEGTQLSQVDRQNGSPKSSTVKDQKQLLPPSSPPRSVPLPFLNISLS